MKKAALLALLAAFCLFVSGAGAETVRIANVTYVGGAERFVVLPGNKDMFGNFKNMMPGETREQPITIRNDFERPLTFYLRAQETQTGPVSVMLMDVLELTVSAGSALLYQGSLGDSVQKGGLGMGDDISLGRIPSGGVVELTAVLYAPGEEMNNRYMNLSTSVDWVITVMDPDPGPTPTPILPPGGHGGTPAEETGERYWLNVGDCFD